MATTTNVKFYKKGYDSATAAAAQSSSVEGSIVFDTKSKSIYVAGTAFGGNITDVTLSNSILTITKAVGNTITLNFSDTASASATMKVFGTIGTVIGANVSTGGDKLDYSSTNYLNGYTEGEKTVAAVTNLVDADKRLDALIKAINDEIAAMNGTATIASATDGVVTLKAGVKQTNGTIAQGEGDDITLKKVATTGAAEDVTIADAGGVITATNVEGALQEIATEIDNMDYNTDKAANLATKSGNVITLATTISEEDGKIEVSGTQSLAEVAATGAANELTVTSATYGGTTSTTNAQTALNNLAQAISDAEITIDGQKGAITTGNGLNDVTAESKVLSVKGNGDYIDVTSDGVAVKNVDTTGASTTETNLATVKTVTEHIAKLDADAQTVVALDSDKKKLQGATISETDGTIAAGTLTDLVTFNTALSDSNNAATMADITSAIGALDVTDNIQALTQSTDATSGDVTLTFKGTKETDGKIEQGTGTDTLVLKKVATTGKSEDVSYDNKDNKVIKTADDVQEAIDAIDTELASLVGGMRYNGDIDSATATLNKDTEDVRPGDIYLASGAFEIGTISVEAGDMIVYKGEKSTSPVALTETNCTVIEKETDLMVTANDTLTDDYLVFGNGNRTVATTYGADSKTISAADLATAMTNANSALQSISKGTDGDYVTTTVSEKGTGTTQTVATSVTVQSVSGASTTAKGLAEASDVKDYVDTSISNLDSTVTSDDAAVATVKVEEKAGKITDVVVTTIDAGLAYNSTDKTITASTATGAVTGSESNIKAITDYVDAKVGSAVQSVDASTTEKAKSVTQDTYVTVKVAATTSTDNKVTLDTSAQLNMATVTDGSVTTDGVATASNAKAIADKEIASIAEASKDDTDAGVKVEVKTAAGSVSAVDVAVTAATVTYTAKTDTDPATLTASDTTSVLTGAAVSSIKNYVDAQKASVEDKGATVTVNDTVSTTLATIDGTNITAKAVLVWEEWS